MVVDKFDRETGLILDALFDLGGPHIYTTVISDMLK